MRFLTSRLYALLSNPCVWSKNGTPLINGFALLILAIVLLTLIIKAAPALMAGIPGVLLYQPVKAVWKKLFG
ncbi:MAG TPA: hypothetical protein VHU83_09230 [Bryobacteraceae bacterium]|jgi:hypothetical protein|nr:hypothetical protein [Bryobacteraceae bacterium]